VEPERARIALDGLERRRARWRMIAVNKPRGVVTTRSDPQGRRTAYDVLGSAARGLIAVGRLDLATSGLLLLTSDTRLSDWIADPVNAVPRVYAVSVRGRVDERAVARLTAGLESGGDRLQAEAVTVRKTSGRESHLTVELREGRNREVRRLFAAVGHEVTRLKRLRVGGIELGALEPGAWRELTASEVAAAFPGAPIAVGSGGRNPEARRRSV
jgi:23S rRNA pseudouridine2605 synthase